MVACRTNALRRSLAVAALAASIAPAIAAPAASPQRASVFTPPALVALTGLPTEARPVALTPSARTGARKSDSRKADASADANAADVNHALTAAFASSPPPVVAWFEVRPVLTPADSAAAADIAWSLLDDNGRELAGAVGDWVNQRGVSNQRRRLRAELAQGYAARGFTPFWIESGAWRPAVASAVARLAKAGDDALDLRAYAMPSPDKLSPTAQDELNLSEAVAAYALQARGARIEPEALSHLIGATTTLPDPAQAVAEVSAADYQAGDVLRAFNPSHYGYQQLREKLSELRAQRLVTPAVDQLLAVATELQSDAPPPGRKRRRAEEPPTASLLESEVIANMERWRWLPRDLGDPRIEVNIPDFELALVRDGQVAHRTKVIVGKEKTPTPIFSDEMEEIIVNPSWYVPQSIIQKEWGGSVGKGYQVSSRHGQMIVRQPPGERNALGRVKFVFPNDFAVYMHDTPQRGLFSETHRAFSHGCMRVFEPFALAEAVLGPNSGWTEAKVKKMIGPSERFIGLPKKIPVHVEYFTAYVDETGQLVQRPDLYGYSARVRRALGLGG